METEQILGIICIVLGLFSLILREGLIKMQGSPKKGFYPEHVRRRKIITGGTSLIIVGLVIIIYFN